MDGPSDNCKCEIPAEFQDSFAFVPHTSYMYDTFVPNLSAFCKRIGYYGPLNPCLEVLKAIHFHFILTFPFENLSIHGLPHVPLTEPPVSVDPAIIEKKLLGPNRGGYCFELNQYFYCILRAVGFTVAPKCGRVLWMREPGLAQARVHLVSLVLIDNTRYLCDVSFGGNSPPMPLLLDSESPQECLYDTYRIVSMPKPYPSHHKLLQIRKNDPVNKPPSELLSAASTDSEWISMYFFDEHELSTVADWEQGNYQVCTYPDTLFTAHVLLGFTTLTGRLALFDNKFSEKRFVNSESVGFRDSSIQGNEESEERRVRNPLVNSSGEVRGTLAFETVEEEEILTKEAYVRILRDKFKFHIPDEAIADLRLPGTTW